MACKICGNERIEQPEYPYCDSCIEKAVDKYLKRQKKSVLRSLQREAAKKEKLKNGN